MHRYIDEESKDACEVEDFNTGVSPRQDVDHKEIWRRLGVKLICRIPS